MSIDADPDALRETVRAKYAERARRVADAAPDGACCGPSSPCCSSNADPITSDLYSCDEVAAIPDAAVKASLGCGNPTALAALARRSSTSAAAAGSMSCSRPGGSGRPASPTAWT
jgi:arsenite methyltransferase